MLFKKIEDQLFNHKKLDLWVYIYLKLRYEIKIKKMKANIEACSQCLF